VCGSLVRRLFLQIAVLTVVTCEMREMTCVLCVVTCKLNGSTTRATIRYQVINKFPWFTDARCTEKTRVSSYGSILYWNRTLLATHAARGPDARRETEMGEGTEPNSRKHGTSVGMNTRLEHVPRVQYSPKEGTGLHAGTPHPKAYKSLILCCHHLRGVQRQTRKVETAWQPLPAAPSKLGISAAPRGS
jgi:hypothetical protein